MAVIRPEVMDLIGDTFADVLWWNSKEAAVRCPYCQGEHVHGHEESLASLIDSNETHKPPCLRSEEHVYYAPYKLRFPEHCTVDRKKWRFVTGEEVSPDVVLEGLRAKLIEQKFLESCEVGDVSAVTSLVSLNRVACGRARDLMGNTGLTIAASHGHHELCSSLLGEKLDDGFITSQNFLGRNALMEASLWGKLDTFHVLLPHFRSNVGDVFDNIAFSACNLADDRIPRNYEERMLRKQWKASLQDGAAEIQQRRVIHWVLTNLTSPPESISDAWLPLTPTAISENVSNTETLLLSPVGAWDNPGDANVGAMSTGNKGAPLILARTGRNKEDQPITLVKGTGVIGGSHIGPGMEEQFEIGNKTWTAKVHELCEQIGHTLIVDPKADEGGQPGSGDACHAEKLLIAYFLNSHVIGPKELTEGSSEAALRTTKPGGEIKRVDVICNHQPCPSCQRFKIRVEDHFGVHIALTVVPTLMHGQKLSGPGSEIALRRS